MNLRRFVRGVLRWGFHQLYHGWAWTYDGIAAIVSLGRWYDWVLAVRPFIGGRRVLEIGPGTGHLLEALAGDPELRIIGIDESPNMLQLARHRTAAAIPLVRGIIERLPLEASCIDTIVATFPSDFIGTETAIHEYGRVLRLGGRLVTLPVAQLAGRGIVETLLAWVLVLIGETPKDPAAAVTSRIVKPLLEAGFVTALERIRLRDSEIFVVVAVKPG